MKVIGSADEFWRLRLTRLDTTDLDFEWHEDILYREPQTEPVEEAAEWHVEAVRLDDYDMLVRIASFNNRAEADGFYDRARLDLAEMTKTQFEESYLSGEPPVADHEGPLYSEEEEA